MKEHIFREYDIRGIFPDELNRDSVHRIGSAVGSYLLEKGAAEIALGRDCRLSSEPLGKALLDGLLGSGIHVVQVGMVRPRCSISPSTPFRWMAAYKSRAATIRRNSTDSRFVSGRPPSMARKSSRSERLRSPATGEGERECKGNPTWLVLPGLPTGKHPGRADQTTGGGGWRQRRRRLGCDRRYRAMGHEVIPLFVNPTAASRTITPTRPFRRTSKP